VGSGPAGLSCAHHLARMGYEVTVFEALPAAGGMMRVGIPSYRLPRDVLQREIDDILSLGVELRLNTPIRISTNSSKKVFRYFMTIGSTRASEVRNSREDVTGVFHGVPFLHR